MRWLAALFIVLIALLRGAGGSVPSQAYSYDALTGEPAAVASGTASAAYSYRTGTRQICCREMIPALVSVEMFCDFAKRTHFAGGSGCGTCTGSWRMAAGPFREWRKRIAKVVLLSAGPGHDHA